MAETKNFPEGIRAFKARESAPDYVKASISITVDEFEEWLAGAGRSFCTKFKGKEQINLTLKESQKGTYYLEVDTYVRGEKSESESKPLKPKPNIYNPDTPDDIPL